MGAILIVDDDFDVRDALIDVLVDEGFVVRAVSDGWEALEFLRNNPPPSLILLDWMMPRCDALQFRTEQLKDGRIASIPVVLLTADPRGVDKLQRVQADGILSKPIAIETLLAVVRRYCAAETGPRNGLG